MRTLVLASLFLAVLLFLASCTNATDKAESRTQTPPSEKKETVTIQTVTLDIEGIT